MQSVGKVRNYGPTAKHLEEERRQAEIRLREEQEARQAEAKHREEEEEEQRARRWEEWVKKHKPHWSSWHDVMIATKGCLYLPIVLVERHVQV